MAAGTKVSALTQLAKGSVDPDADFLPIVDTDAGATKKATPEAVVSDALLDLHVDITDPDDSSDIQWPTADATRGPLMISVFEGNPGNPDGSKNPSIGIGYNRHTTGTIINATDGSGAVWQIEGNWYDGSNYVSEGYLEFHDGTNSSRPFFCKWDKGTSFITNTDVIGGPTNGIYFRADDQAAGGDLMVQFTKNTIKFYAPSAAANNVIIESAASQSSTFVMTANADNSSTKPSVKFLCQTAGGSSQHRQLILSMSDKDAAKTGTVTLRADDDATYDSVMVGIGASAGANTALVTVDHANMPVGFPTVQIVAKASQTAATFRMDGITAAGAAEAQKWQLFPKGSISVKPSGGAVTAPQTGANAVTSVTFGAFPGSSTTGDPDMWFPMLDANGALYWIPGWSN